MRQDMRDGASLRVMGIDPGLTRMGYGILQSQAGRLACLATGTVRTSPGESSERLKRIFEALSELIGVWRPQALAVEKVFLKLNLKTGIPAIQSWGVALLAGALAGLQVHEYSPAQVKQSVTGVGAATKEQVQFMMKKILTDGPSPDSPDAADALAVAVTHIHFRSTARLEAAL